MPRRDATGVSTSPVREPIAGACAFELGAIYDQHSDFVWRTLRRYGVPPASIDDAVQDAFLVVHARLAQFEGRSSLRTWLFGIARRVARDHRGSRREPSGGASADALETLPDASTKSPLATLEDVEAARLLEGLLARLAPAKREAFILVELEEMTMTEASEALGTNIHTLAARVRAARQELKQALARLEANRAWSERCGR